MSIIYECKTHGEWDAVQASGCPECVRELRAENAALRADYESACGLVADMHAAAVGEVRGPTLGVVEDIEALRSRLADLEAERALIADHLLTLQPQEADYDDR